MSSTRTSGPPTGLSRAIAFAAEHGVPSDLAANRIPLTWSMAEGLCIFDQFGGAEPFEIMIPSALAQGRTQPDLILTTRDDETAFLAQRWTEARITTWHVLETLGVDSASVCVTPRAIAEGISGRGLLEADRLLADTDSPWLQLALDDKPLIGVRIPGGDGDYALWVALDSAGSPVGWVLDFGVIALPGGDEPAA